MLLRDSGFLNGLLLVAVVACALSAVASQHKARKLLNELQTGKEYAGQMEVEWGQLQLEQSTLTTSARIEKIAVKQLQMNLPKSGQIQIVRIDQPTDVLERPSAQSSPAGMRGSNRPLSLSAKGEQSLTKGANQQP